MEKIKNIFIKYLWLMPILCSLLVLIIYGKNVIDWDEWELVHLYEDIRQNGFSLNMFFKQHNEHRAFFPLIIMIISGHLTCFNVKINMFITQIMAILLYCAIIRYFFKHPDMHTESPKENKLKSLYILLFGFACFSYIQYDNFLWGFQVAFYMAIFCSACSIYYLHKYVNNDNKMYCLISVILGVIASFSSMHGLVIWPVIIVLFLICIISGDRSIIKKSMPFILSGIMCYLVYFAGWKHPAAHPDLILNPYTIFKYMLGAFGGMYIGAYSSLGLFLGGITLLLNILLVFIFFKLRRLKEVFFPVGLFGCSCAALIMIAAGRAGISLDTSVSSRYMSFSVLSYISIIMLFYQLLIIDNNDRKKTVFLNNHVKKITLFSMIVLSIFLIFGNIKGISRARKTNISSNEKLSILQNYDKQELEKLQRLYPWSSYEDAYSAIGILKKYRLNAFTNEIYVNNE